MLKPLKPRSNWILLNCGKDGWRTRLEAPKNPLRCANGLFLPEFPVKIHASIWGRNGRRKQTADCALAGAGLLNQCVERRRSRRGRPDHRLPSRQHSRTAEGHKDLYACRQEARLNVQIDNERNKEKRAGMNDDARLGRFVPRAEDMSHV